MIRYVFDREIQFAVGTGQLWIANPGSHRHLPPAAWDGSQRQDRITVCHGGRCRESQAGTRDRAADDHEQWWFVCCILLRLYILWCIVWFSGHLQRYLCLAVWDSTPGIGAYTTVTAELYCFCNICSPQCISLYHIILASTLSSIWAICPNRVRCHAWIIFFWLVWRRTSSLEMKWYHLMPMMMMFLYGIF